MSFLTIVLCVLCLWLHVLWKRRKYYELCLKVPGPLGYPFLGMAHALIKREEILQNFRKYEKIHGELFYSWLGPQPILIVCEPKIAQDILTSSKCVNKAEMYEAINEASGRGLFGLNEPQWSKHRKLLNPAFSYTTLVGLMPIFNEESGNLLKSLDTTCGKGEIDIMNLLQYFTLSTATKTTMGNDLMSGSSNQFNLLRCYQELLEIMTSMCFSPWLRVKLFRWVYGLEEPYMRAKTSIKLFIRSIISRKLSDVAVGPPSSDENSFLNLTIDLYRKGIFTYENVEDETNVIVFGAFETTANTIGYTLMLLAMFPNYQQKLFDEIKTLYPDNRGDFVVSISEIKRLEFLDKVLDETMRLMAPVPLIARHVSEDFELSNGITIPAGVQVAIDIFNMHRRTDIWGPDAHTFNPDNFSLEEKHSYAFIPFTKGIRSCIGQRYALLSIKVALIKLLRNYEFKTNFDFEDLQFVEGITLKLKKVPLLQLSRRDS